MTIQTTIYTFNSYREMGDPKDIEVPVIEPGDKVELSGWIKPVIGTVVEATESSVWCDVPVATPGKLHATSILCVKKLWRGDEVWASAE